MCLSPDEMPSNRLEEKIELYRQWDAEDDRDDYWGRQADMLQDILKQRTEAGTYDVIPEVTPRHIHAF